VEMSKLITFFFVSIGLGYISRGSLRTPRSHGFYRFFAWECIVALFLLHMANGFAIHRPGFSGSPGFYLPSAWSCFSPGFAIWWGGAGRANTGQRNRNFLLLKKPPPW
jgi:hypothetical protein